MKAIQFLLIISLVCAFASTALAQRKETDGVKEPLRALAADHPFRKVLTQALAEARKMEGCHGVLIIFNKWSNGGRPKGNSPLEQEMKKAGIEEGHSTTVLAMKMSPAKE